MPRRLLCLRCLVVAAAAVAVFGCSPIVKHSASRHHEQATGGSLPLRDAVVLGIVEGATEYLPVSSTGHLLIVQHLRGMGSNDEEAEAANALAICIQSGAILAVVLLYFGRLRQMLRGVCGRDADGLRLLRNLWLAFLPAAVMGLLFHDWIKRTLFGIAPVAAALFAGGLLILATAPKLKQSVQHPQKGLAEMDWRDALLVGLMQCLAFWPGFSRSLATILGCMWAGLELAAAVEFSFLLGLITLSAATAFEALQSGQEMLSHYGLVPLLMALLAAFISAALSIRFMVTFLGRFGLAPFAYYRIALAALCLLWL